MKIQALCSFIIFVLSLHLILTHTKASPSANVNGYFYVQKIHKSDDPFLLIKESEQKMALKYFTLNENVLAMSPSKEKAKIIEETILLESLFDKDADDVKKGKCCKNVILRNFEGCVGDKCKTTTLPGIPSEMAANYCIEITKLDNFIWRLCSDNRVYSSRLQKRINYNILKIKAKGKLDKKVIEKFMLDTITEIPRNDWHWDSQQKWGGNCQEKRILQSPVDIIPQGKTINLTSAVKFEIAYNFGETLTVVKKHHHEMHIYFQDSAGVLKYKVEDSFLFFQAQYLSFRFPGEHLINGKRNMGEVLIHFTELNPNRKTWITNGLIISIPLSPEKDGPNHEFFEALNPDFWKMGTKKSGGYTPKQALKKKQFSLRAMMEKVFAEDGKAKENNFYSYVGSESIPPCTGNIIYIIFENPLKIANCQFKILRESSLLTERPREIHARLPQALNDRAVYKFSKAQIVYKANLGSYVEQAIKIFKPYVKVPGNVPIKKPYFPKNVQQLNKKIEELNKRTVQAMKLKGPEKKKALEAIKRETDPMSCNKL